MLDSTTYGERRRRRYRLCFQEDEVALLTVLERKTVGRSPGLGDFETLIEVPRVFDLSHDCALFFRRLCHLVAGNLQVTDMRMSYDGSC